MLKMRPLMLLLVMFTTITFSSSKVLPILSIHKVDSNSLLEEQDVDNTNRQTRINPNIFYKVFIGTSRDSSPKYPQGSQMYELDNDNNPDIKLFNGLNDETEINFDPEDFRKEQWHTFPTQLDRLHKKSVNYEERENILNSDDTEPTRRMNKIANGGFQYTNDIISNFNSDIINGPLLILKIKLAYLSNFNNRGPNKYTYIDSELPNFVTDNDQSELKLENSKLLDKDDKSIIKLKKKATLDNFESENLANSLDDKKTVKKRIFSLWSRLQSLSHKGHELHHRRHLYALYGLPEDGGGALTAETRATLMRPPGSPLRWG